MSAWCSFKDTCGFGVLPAKAGYVFVIRMTYSMFVVQVVENEDSFKEAIANSMNSYCTENTEECCEAMQLVFKQTE